MSDRARVEEIIRLHNIDTVKIGGPDFDGVYRGKRLPVDIFLADIEHGYVWTGLADPDYGLVGRGCLTHDGHVLLSPQQVTHPSANQFVIIKKEHAERHHPSLPHERPFML